MTAKTSINTNGRDRRVVVRRCAAVTACAVSLALLAGCSQPTYYFTFPPGHTQQDFQRDLRVCQMDSQTVQMNTWMGGRTPGQIDRRFVACMRQLGYTETRADP